MIVIGCLLAGAVLVSLGLWGRRNAARLAPDALPADERVHREQVLRRGGLTCQVVAALLAGLALLDMVT